AGRSPPRGRLGLARGAGSCQIIARRPGDPNMGDRAFARALTGSQMAAYGGQAAIRLPDAAMEMDAIFRALADPSRRRLLDRLNQRNGQSLRELCAGLDMTRQSVSKHLDILAEANLVAVVWRGREKLHYLNAAPISEIAERWISHYDRQRVSALSDLKKALEETP